MTNPEKFGGYYDGGDDVPATDGVAASGYPSNPDTTKEQTTAFEIPKEYADRGYTKGFKSNEDVWKSLDGAQSQLGKRALPDENSSPEEWNNLYSKLGKPAGAEEYKFNREGFSKEFQESQNEDYDKAVKGVFHKANLTSKQATFIQTEVEKIAETIQKEYREKEKAQDKAFDELTQKTFGANKDQIIEDTSKILKEIVPEELKPKLAGLGNEELVILSSVIQNFKNKYIDEDNSGGKDGIGSESNSIESLRQKAKAIMQSPEYRDSFNPISEAKRKEVSEIYERIAKLSS